MKDLIKQALQLFREELTIHISNINLQPEVFHYLIRHHLVTEDAYTSSYYINPKGFNWDVDREGINIPAWDGVIKLAWQYASKEDQAWRDEGMNVCGQCYFDRARCLCK